MPCQYLSILCICRLIMVRPRVCRCLALCQLAALLREAHLLEAVCFALKVKFGVGTRAWTNVILVAALICLVV